MSLRSLLRRKAALKPKGSLRGGIEGVCCGVPWGEVLERGEPRAAATAEILIGGVLLGRAQASVTRAEYVDATAAGVPCGFVFDLRPHPAGITRGVLSLRAPATGAALGDEAALDLAGAFSPAFASSRTVGESSPAARAAPAAPTAPGDGGAAGAAARRGGAPCQRPAAAGPQPRRDPPQARQSILW